MEINLIKLPCFVMPQICNVHLLFYKSDNARIPVRPTTGTLGPKVVGLLHNKMSPVHKIGILPFKVSSKLSPVFALLLQSEDDCRHSDQARVCTDMCSCYICHRARHCEHSRSCIDSQVSSLACPCVSAQLSTHTILLRVLPVQRNGETRATQSRGLVHFTPCLLVSGP